LHLFDQKYSITCDGKAAITPGSSEFFGQYKVKKTNKQKKQHLFEMEISCSIVNVFTVTFDQFIASLLNESCNFFKKIGSGY